MKNLCNIAADVPSVDTIVTNYGNSSKSTQKEVMSDVSELVSFSQVQKNHPSRSIIGDPFVGITTRKKDKINYTKMIANICYTSSIEPTPVNEALKNELWINAMQEKLLQFKWNNVWTLVPKPSYL